MTEHPPSQADQKRVPTTVTRLVTAADGDTLYRDVYLRRAAALLAPIVSAASYVASLTDRRELQRLLAQARAAVDRKDWTQVGEIGAQAASLQRSLETDEHVMSAAASVYGAPPVVLDPLSPGLATPRWSNAAAARTDVCAALADLAREDAGMQGLYSARRRALEALVLAGAAAGGAPGSGASAGNVEQQALQALERGDAAALQRLAQSMLGGRAAPHAAGAEADTAVGGSIETPTVLGDPIPAAAVPRAAALGLESVVDELPSGDVSRAVGEFIERYALGASPAVHDRANEGVARMAVAARELAVPGDVAAIFAETISLFALHQFVNSAGVRYVPIPSHREAMLIETHAEGDETVTPLLRALGLDRRRALSRDDIEDALQKHAAGIVADQIGLDPLAFRLVCVPPDVFMRVGRTRGWGQRPEWTHFDGYQVMQGGRLRALVGGNAKFGGLGDLCSIGSYDARDNTFARFAVVRRDRLGVRLG